jgi:beta-glucosidase
MQKKPSRSFPKDFLWGAGTSALQVEGGITSQWTEWEKANAKSLATQAPHLYSALPGWERHAKLASLPANYISGKAVDHYHRYREDFDLLESMNMNAFRFSIEWSRIQPEEGTWNAEAIHHYKDYLDELLRRNIEPVVTLFHFSLPVWFAEKGGFEKKQNVGYFVDYAERIIEELGPRVRYIITINEPNVYAVMSYYEAVWPPQKSDWRSMRRVLNNLARAHNQAAKRIKEKSRRVKLSVAYNSSYVYAGDDAWLSNVSAFILQYFKDDYFLGQVRKHCDFLGVNFYFTDRVFGYRVHNPEQPLSDVGSYLAPEMIEFVLTRLHDKYKLPIMITENGLADGQDAHREWWITETIKGMQRAMASGVTLLGYLHWSLTDNIELHMGRWPRYGLAEVDYRTYARRLRPSALWFGKVIKRLRKV